MNPDYQRFHPEWHRERMPIFWWLAKWSYTRFISRELTSLAVAFAALMLMVEVRVLRTGEGAYLRFQAWLNSPWALVLNGAVFLVLLLHTTTWLNLAPRAMVLTIRGRKVPNGLILAAHYLAWLAASVVVAWFLLKG